ncbi:MAG: hypothetical protein HC902_10435 [Calothrix sp. SM1_5_4]|nr:hypothetical protein [Calothrix sp. SM1_5_4]
MAELALSDLATWDGFSSSRVLAAVDEMLLQVAELNEHAAIVVRFFNTQRLRLPPARERETFARTRALFEELLWIAAVYRDFSDSETEARRAAELCDECVPRIREYEFAAVEERFQALVSTLHELARHSTKVGGAAWSDLLARLNESLGSRDFVDLADILQFELKPALQKQFSGKETLAQDVVSCPGGK